MDNDNLGKFGESQFKSWCNAAGYAINSSSEHDATGWDFKIEPKHLLIDNTMLGLNPENAYSHSVIDVQIKTTTKDTSKWSIKLEHLIRFAHSPHPAFLCIIQVDTKINNIKKIHLIHIDQKHIKNILKKQRQLAKKGKDVHNKTLSIKGDSSNIYLSDFANEIKNTIEKVLENGAQSYTQNKQKLLKTVGYDTTAGNIKFSAGLDEIVNTSLGLDDSFSVNDFSIEDLRFNIPLKKDIGPGQLTIKPEEKDATILLTCPDMDSLIFPVKARISPFFDMNSDNLASMSFLHEAFHIAMFEGRATFIPKTPDDISIKNLQSFASLRHALQVGCEFNIHLNGRSLRIPITSKSLNGKNESYKNWGHILWFCNFLIKESLGNTVINLNELLHQGGVLVLMQNIIEKIDTQQIYITFDPETSDTLDTQIVNTLKIPFVIMIKLKDIVYTSVYNIKNLNLMSNNKKNIKLSGTTSNTEFFGSFTFPSFEISKFNELYSQKVMEFFSAENKDVRYLMDEGHVFNFSSFLKNEDNKNETIIT